VTRFVAAGEALGAVSAVAVPLGLTLARAVLGVLVLGVIWGGVGLTVVGVTLVGVTVV
jgi:hypothetical protein